MKYAVEMDSGAMIYIPNFIRSSSTIQRLIEGDKQTQNVDRISLLLFFPYVENRPKNTLNFWYYCFWYVSLLFF
jgi:hypothetical protein